MSKKDLINVTKNNRVIALPAMQIKDKNGNENKTLYDILRWAEKQREKCRVGSLQINEKTTA